ncbi:MAG TPA: DUF839 domain-containing protein [Pirellulaceae bacterium]|nr:DUF839 domain-containing protein [Pirellulaceae bacterium]
MKRHATIRFSRKQSDKRGRLVRFELLEQRVPMAADLGFTSLAGSVTVGTLPETSPFALARQWTQSVLESQSTLGPGEGMPVGNDGSSWNDMLTMNESGVQPGRYLFRAHELFTSLGGNAGISRTDLATGQTVVIAQRADYDAFDPVFWTPWGTILTGEESANVPSQFRDPAHPDSVNGLVYEILNPLADPADIQIVARPALGSMAHEGIQFDAAGNVYVIDEFNGGGIYKFAPTRWGDLSQGQLFVLKDASAADGADLGAATWTPLNDSSGLPIANVTDPRINGRQSADDVGATNYLRPEDMQWSRLANGNEVLYVATTTDNRVLSIEFSAGGPIVRNFISRATPVVNPDGSIGAAVDSRLNSPDNLAIDGDGRLYVVEDFGPSDIWGTIDADNNGVAEAVGLFASLSTAGAEATGLYFNPFNPNEAFVNVQHSASHNDATILLRKAAPVSGAAVRNGVLAVYGSNASEIIQVEARNQGRQLVARVGGIEALRVDSNQVSSLRVDAGGGNDSVQVSVMLELASIVFGGGGNDFINAGAGKDVLVGGDGNDRLFGNRGDDLLFGNSGADQLYGGDGEDWMSGGDGNDNLWGGNGNDSMFGDADNDWLYGDAGADLLDGGDGFDWLFGGLGLDTLRKGERLFQ